MDTDGHSVGIGRRGSTPRTLLETETIETACGCVGVWVCGCGTGSVDGIDDPDYRKWRAQANLATSCDHITHTQLSVINC